MNRDLHSPTRRAFLTGLAMILPSAAFAARAEWTPNDFHPLGATRSVIGIASYYGAREKMHRTASGEIFDPQGYSAAHRVLPFGTLLRLTNLENSRCVVVKVNDRGPNNRKCIIDLSEGAARELDMCRAGLARVSLAIIA